ncbi:hypothetical protein ACN38_g12961 [Penicillium nordicum]|uniref:Protein kinase domain-containing protein n=1 Tax=Penicillium nordicum TaxID=229535 RepID=A0A0M8NPW4_9EURO|nr:hypothetical protein ACN38_g12961 [Penicillium nordicum]
MIHPHPNIATYLGCQVSGGVITGLCLEKYPRTPTKEVNPGALMKRALRNTREARGDYSRVLTDIDSGIRYLHSLGAIIIDFGSCRKIGESLKDVGRTYEWYDREM